MRQQQEVVFDAVCFPVSGGFTVVLLFDNQFLEREARVLEYLHHVKAHRYNAALFAGVAHQNGAEFAVFYCAQAFQCYNFHLL